ncbi:MAG: HAMP domain-containing protein [Gammaproteobacteria bacterium]|nr:HAMP domain-containing protein [Gammaproteobacteria bacterium]
MRFSTSARLTLANSALLAVSFAALLLLVTWLADRFMVEHVQESVKAELRILQAELQVDGIPSTIALIRQRMQSTTLYHDRLYRLENAAGTLLAGNVESWPATNTAPGQFFKRPSRKYPGETEVVLQWTRLADGGRLLVGFDEIEVAQVRGDIRRAALRCLGAMLLVSFAAGFLLTRSALKPVEAIRAAAQRIMEGDLRHRIPTSTNGDEFDRLGETLNSMLDRINALIVSVRGATDNIAHDLRSPLTRLRARQEVALRDPPLAADLQPWIERNLVDLDQVLATFHSLLRIASVESGLLRQEFADCDVGQLMRDAADYIEPLIEEKTQQLMVSVGPGPPFCGHRHLLFQLLINLLDNAVKYSPVGTSIILSARATATGWELEISDAGPGIPAEQRARVFERLYRLDASRHTPGLGLGLSVVKAIVGLHQGTVGVQDNAPGTRIVVTMPL